MIALALFVLCATGVDPRVSEAQTLAAHGEDDAALAGLLSVLHDVEDSGADGSAGLHFNIGTLALRTGDTGLAVQHLLSAWRRAPTDADVVHNLQLAKEAREDRLEQAAAPPLGGRIPPDAARVCFAVAALFFCAVVVARGASGRVPVVVVVAATVVFAAAGSAFALRKRFEGEEVQVVRKDTAARAAPDVKATAFDVHAGLSGVVLEKRGDWLQLRLENGVESWLAADACDAVR